MSRPQVAQRVWEIAEPLTAQQGFEVVDVEYRPERGRMILRIYVDRADGVSLDDLSRLSRELGDLLEVREVVESSYTLEVSSPGINRPLRRLDHFRRFIGRRVRVRTTDAIDGRRNFVGDLLAVSDDSIVLRIGDAAEVEIPFEAVKRANYEHDFDAGHQGSAARPSASSAETMRRT